MSSGFVTESEALEIRKKRQEEWERVRNASDPIERPEEPYDNRSLYDRLQEQKQKKDLEYEEAHKLKNMIKGLDDDEVNFLDYVDQTKLAADRIKTQEEEKELNDYRNRVATLQEQALDQKLATGVVTVNKPKTPSQGQKRSQVKLLQGAVVKKSDNEKKRKLDSPETESEEKTVKDVNVKENTTRAIPSAMQCVGILPGLGYYENTSSDDTSDSDSDGEDNCGVKIDLLGRKIVPKETNEES